MTQVSRRIRIAAVALAAGLTLSACGGDDAGSTIVVGSKDFTENILLGQMLVVALEEAGIPVEDRTNLGGTVVNRDALLAGDINVYPEYNGTGWTVHLEQEDPSFDRDVLYNAVAEKDLADNGIRWVGHSPFNNTYGFASSPAATAANGGELFTFQTMAQYMQDNPDAVACMESEFPDRPDGLILTETATGIELPDSQQNILDTGVIYTETAADNCTFGEVFTTDGRIPALGLTLVEDPGVNILYNVSATIRNETFQEAPEAFEGIVDAILAPLDNVQMAELNARVSAEGEEPAAVARDYLVEQGIIAG